MYQKSEGIQVARCVYSAFFCLTRFSPIYFGVKNRSAVQVGTEHPTQLQLDRIFVYPLTIVFGYSSTEHKTA